MVLNICENPIDFTLKSYQTDADVRLVDYNGKVFLLSFVCIRCGWCCTHEWRVNLTWDEYDRLKDKLPISEVVMDKKTGMSHPFYMIKDKCAQYDTKTHKCKIYKMRAYSCATYPFSITPEGKLVRSKFCKGFGKGDIIDRRKMKRYIMKWRKRAGMTVGV